MNLDALVTEVIQPTLDAEKIPWHGWHAFRRGLATNLHRLGVSAKVIQQVLRHANVTTTINIYVKMVTQDAEEAMKKLETKCSLVVPQTVPQLLPGGTQLGTKNGIITVQKVLPLEAVRENLAEGEVRREPFSVPKQPNREKIRELRTHGSLLGSFAPYPSDGFVRN